MATETIVFIAPRYRSIVVNGCAFRDGRFVADSTEAELIRSSYSYQAHDVFEEELPPLAPPPTAPPAGEPTAPGGDDTGGDDTGGDDTSDGTEGDGTEGDGTTTPPATALKPLTEMTNEELEAALRKAGLSVREGRTRRQLLGLARRYLQAPPAEE